MMHPAQGAFAAEPEVADMQQRLRVGADTISKDLIMAGAGAYQGLQAGSLGYYFPSVLPFRQGATNDDPPGTFATDRITIIYVPSTTAQTTLGADLSGATTTFTPAVESDCPRDPATGQPAKLCGFAKDQTVLVYDDSGSYNLFTITAVADSTATLTVKKPGDADSTTFAAGSKIVEASSHTYYLKTDVPNDIYQLMHYDGTSNSDVPVVDNVVGLEFELLRRRAAAHRCGNRCPMSRRPRTARSRVLSPSRRGGRSRIACSVPARSRRRSCRCSARARRRSWR